MEDCGRFRRPWACGYRSFAYPATAHYFLCAQHFPRRPKSLAHNSQPDLRMKIKLSTYLVAALAFTCFSYTPGSVLAQGAAGSVVACPGQGTLPTGSWEFDVYIGSDVFYTTTASVPSLGSTLADFVQADMDGSYRCKNESSQCVDAKPCTKQSSYSAGQISIVKVESASTHPSPSDFRDTYGKDHAVLMGMFPVLQTTYATKVTYKVDLGTGNTSNCLCPL